MSTLSWLRLVRHKRQIIIRTSTCYCTQLSIGRDFEFNYLADCKEVNMKEFTYLHEIHKINKLECTHYSSIYKSRTKLDKFRLHPINSQF